MLGKVLLVAGFLASLALGVVWGNHALTYHSTHASGYGSHVTVASHGSIPPDGIIWGD